MSLIRHFLEKQWDLMSRGFKACKNSLAKYEQAIAQVQDEVRDLKTMLRDNKAISVNLPHGDLLKYIPFQRDEDIVTVLDNPDLNNALFAQVWSLIYYHLLSRLI